MRGSDDDVLRDAWAAQTIDSERPDLTTLVAAVGELEATVARRNRRELVAAAVVIVAFSAIAVAAADPLGQLGAAAIAAGAVFVSYTLLRRGRTAAPPAALALECVAWRKAELVRERDLLAGIWRWYLGPLVPGFVMFLASGALRADTTGELAIHAVVAAVSVAVFGGIGWANAAAARALDAELRAMDTPRG